VSEDAASKYLLLDRIAVGGMAEVYRAKSLGIEGFEKIVAIKRILPALAQDAEFVQMFVEEAKIAGQLRHANIGRILELGKIEGTHFIAMEYVFGKDLLEIRRRLAAEGRRMPPVAAAWVMAQVLAALDYAHRQRDASGQPLGLIHRDVSPMNVLVSYDGQVKLIDFGIAKAASRATQTVAGVIKGKLGYMSPEQVRGQELDHRSDLFAASTCLHEALTGKPLFSAGTDIDTMERVRNAVAQPPSAAAPDVPAALDAIVMQGLSRDPNERYATAGDMQEALMMFIGSQGPYSAASLREWMREEFGDESKAQWAHLQRLEGVRDAGERVDDPESGELGLAAATDWDDEPTVIASPSEEDLEASRGAVELSVIVVIEDSLEISGAEELDGPSAPFSLPPPQPVGTPATAPEPGVPEGPFDDETRADPPPTWSEPPGPPARVAGSLPPARGPSAFDSSVPPPVTARVEPAKRPMARWMFAILAVAVIGLGVGAGVVAVLLWM